MSTKKTVTLHLEPEDYARLEAEATRLGKQPGELALAYVETALPEDATRTAEMRRRKGLAALADFAALREELRQKGFPPVDAVAFTNESRNELEERPYR